MLRKKMVRLWQRSCLAPGGNSIECNCCRNMCHGAAAIAATCCRVFGAPLKPDECKFGLSQPEDAKEHGPVCLEEFIGESRGVRGREKISKHCVRGAGNGYGRGGLQWHARFGGFTYHT